MERHRGAPRGNKNAQRSPYGRRVISIPSEMVGDMVEYLEKEGLEPSDENLADLVYRSIRSTIAPRKPRVQHYE